MGGYVAFALLRLARALRPGADPRRHAIAGRHARGRRRPQADAAARRRRRAVGGRRRDDPEAARRDDARDAAGRGRAACARSCWRTPAEAIAGAIRALMTRPDSTPLLADDPRPDADRRRRRGHADAAGRGRGDAPRASPARSWCVFPAPDICRTSSSPTRSTRRSRASSTIGYSREIMRSLPMPCVIRRCRVSVSSSASPSAQDARRRTAARTRKTFDQLLDLYVRDGVVYYRALKVGARQARRLRRPARRRRRSTSCRATSRSRSG